jgi:hypothetical protein
MRIKWRVTGEKELSAKMKRLADRRINASVRETLNYGGDKVATEARKRCPVDTGALRSTIRKIEVKRTGRGVVAYGVQAGGWTGSGGPVSPGIGRTGRAAPPHVDYERYVHEDMSAYHPVGEAKFMEKAMLSEWPLIVRRVRARIKKDIRSKV